MARKFIIVCDICESDKDVQSWEVRHDGGKKRVELCATHSKPLADVMALGEGGDAAASTPSAPRRGGRRPKVQVTTPEEIEAQKAAQG